MAIPVPQPRDIQGTLPLEGFDTALSKQKLIGTAQGAIDDIAQPIFKAQENASYSDAMTKASTQLTAAVQGRYLQQTDEKGNPTYKTLPDDVSKIADDIKTSIMNDIDDPIVSERFSTSFNSLKAAQLSEAIHTSRTQQVNWIKSTLKNTLSHNSLLMGTTGSPQLLAKYRNQNKEALAGAVSQGVLTQPEADDLEASSNKSATKARIRYQISQDPDSVIKSLNKDPKKFALEGVDVLQLKNEAERQKILNQKYILGANKALVTNLKSQMKGVEKQLNTGAQIPAHIYDNMISMTKGTPFEKQTEAFIKASQISQTFSLSSPSDQATALQELTRDPKTAGNLQQIQRFSALHQTVIQGLNKDPYGFSIKQGFSPVPQPLNYDNIGSISANISNRESNMASADHHYGFDIAPLTDEEVNGLKTKLATSSFQQSGAIMQAIVKGAGTNSLSIFRELNKKGAPLYALVGNYMATGKQAIANKILQGIDLVKAAPGLVSQFNDGLINSAASMPRYATPQQLGAVIKGAEMIYAVDLRDNAEFAATSPSNAVKTALKEVTGGTFEYNGHGVESPAPGVDSSSFKDFMKSLTVKDVAAFGGIAGIKTQDDLDRTLNHSTLLSMGNGQYAVEVQVPKTGMSVILKTGDLKTSGGANKVFVLDFNKVLEDRHSTLKEFEDPLTRGIKPLISLESIKKKIKSIKAPQLAS